ncbi:MAG: hypothetical protein VR64_05005 [Desulfatitalea sp. BRH_c12]|nr:MAG: hypothetical protein VR64_05005 [Desulfatitalea sp. BRH_c12]
MTLPSDPIGLAGLQYFGRTTASVSHELKNALAIIKENAGLLNDYLLLAEKGTTIDPARYKTVAVRIEDQTRRADQLIRNMNRFAHSVDSPVQSVVLDDLVALLAALSLREAAMRQVALTVRPTQSTITVTTAPFALLTLLGNCITFALAATQPGQTITLGIAPEGHDVQILFDSLTGLADMPGEAFPKESDKALLTALNARFKADGPAGRMVITLSGR